MTRPKRYTSHWMRRHLLTSDILIERSLVTLRRRHYFDGTIIRVDARTKLLDSFAHQIEMKTELPVGRRLTPRQLDLARQVLTGRTYPPILASIANAMRRSSPYREE